MKSKQQKLSNVAILGAGPCGLYAARVLTQQGVAVTVIDKGERPGGLATSNFNAGNWYDMGVHMLHAHDKEIFEDICQIMGNERIEVDLNAKIRWAKGFYRYPLQFQDIIKGIPLPKLFHQISALFATQIKNAVKPWEAKNAEDALIQLYGKPLYRFFFEEFTHRYWGLHPVDISAKFVTSKMPKLTAVDVIKKGLSKVGIKSKITTTDSPLSQEVLHYSSTGAEAMPRCLSNTIQKNGGVVLQNATVEKVITANNEVRGIVYSQDGQLKEMDCEACISTIPINHLVRSLNPACPEEILMASQQLSYKPIVVFGLLVNKPQCIDALYIYYRNRVFHRVGEPKNAGLVVNPRDHTVLIVELTCDLGDYRWLATEQCKQQIIADLEEEGICTKDEIVEIHVNRCETGYPIFDLNFEKHLGLIEAHLANYTNLQSTGRQGKFTYPNMHSAMRMGHTAASKLLAE